MITDEQVAAYERDGAVIIDGPFINQPDYLDYLEAGWDALHEPAGVKTVDGESVGLRRTAQEAYDEQAYVDCISNPWFEGVAKRVLRAEEVGLFWGLVGSSLHARPPHQGEFLSAEEQWARGLHIDIQATLEDFEATPRRARCELWHWVSDVPEHRGAMRASHHPAQPSSAAQQPEVARCTTGVLLGSHRPSMAHWSAVLTPEQKSMLPRVHGLSPNPPPGRDSHPEHVPPPASGEPWEHRRPTAMVAKRGQVLVLCSTALHSAWQNEDSVTRKALCSPLCPPFPDPCVRVGCALTALCLPAQPLSSGLPFPHLTVLCTWPRQRRRDVDPQRRRRRPAQSPARRTGRLRPGATEAPAPRAPAHRAAPGAVLPERLRAAVAGDFPGGG